RNETMKRFLSLMLLILVGLPTSADAQKKKKGPASAPDEEEYYKLLRYEVPYGEVLEAGAIEQLPDNKIAVGTRRGEIWIIENGLTDDPKAAKFTRFASGMHEILGLAWRK